MSEENIVRFREKYVAVNEAPELMGMPNQTFGFFAQQGGIREIGSDHGVRTGLYVRQDVERLAGRETIMVSEAVRDLGIAAEQIQAWIDQGRLQPLTVWAYRHTGFHRFARADIEKLAQEIG